MGRLLVAIVIVLLSCPARAATLKIATPAPDGTSWMEQMRQGAERVQRRTAGRVTFRFYPGGVMGNDKSVLRKIRLGQLQGAAVTAGGLAEIYPDTQLYGLPFIFRSYEEVDYVRARMDALIMDGLKANGFVSFGLGEGGFAYFMSNQPIRRSADLKQQKMWIPEGDRISRAAFEAVGVSPIPLPLTDVLTGLQTGLVDTITTSPTGAIALQWHTRVKYFTDVPLVYLYGVLVVDRRAFEKLASEDRAIVQEEMGRAFDTLNRQSRRENDGARRALRDQGIEFVQPGTADLDHWRGIVLQAMERLGREGAFSNATLRQMERHLEDFRGAPAAATSRP